MRTETLLEIDALEVRFHTDEGIIRAVDGVSLRVRRGETVCVVGESGCGKSMTAMAVMGLLAAQTAAGRGHFVSGRILFEGRDLLTLGKDELRTMRGRDIAMIFQEPMTALNPVLTVGEQVMEPLIEHLKMGRKAARRRAIELIREVGISRPEQIADSYPHELSGGMLQRVMIATAIACNPKLLIADEPTTALDVTIQAQILDMIRQIKADSDMAVLLITHDLGVVAEMADYVVVMYAGKVVEEGEAEELFANPKHPYTRGLLRSKPVLGRRQDELYSIPGQVPNPLELVPSCYFHGRCEHALPVCQTREPRLRAADGGGKVACWLYEEEAAHV